MIRAASPEEAERWDELVAANPDGGNPLQSRAFAETKAAFGWHPFYAISEQGSRRVAAVYHSRPLPLLGELWYAPKGPGVADAGQLDAFIDATQEARTRLKLKPFVLKIDPELAASDLLEQDLRRHGLDRVRDIQLNNSTVVVDLRPAEAEIQASFKQKTRYNVRLAERKGVTVEPAEATEENWQAMYRLMRFTRDRAGFYLRSYRYFQTFWRLHQEQGSGQLFFAKYQGKLLAGAFVTYLGKAALYKDGGSIREHAEVQAPYLLQWEAMRWLKSRGVERYDLHGVPPRDRLHDPAHPLAPLVQFKTGFNPEVTEFIGTWDLPFRPAAYRFWQRVGERLAMAYGHRVKRELFY